MNNTHTKRQGANCLQFCLSDRLRISRFSFHLYSDFIFLLFLNELVLLLATTSLPQTFVKFCSPSSLLFSQEVLELHPALVSSFLWNPHISTWICEFPGLRQLQSLFCPHFFCLTAKWKIAVPCIFLLAAFASNEDFFPACCRLFFHSLLHVSPCLLCHETKNVVCAQCESVREKLSWHVRLSTETPSGSQPNALVFRRNPSASSTVYTPEPSTQSAHLMSTNSSVVSGKAAPHPPRSYSSTTTCLCQSLTNQLSPLVDGLAETRRAH